MKKYKVNEKELKESKIVVKVPSLSTYKTDSGDKYGDGNFNSKSIAKELVNKGINEIEKNIAETLDEMQTDINRLDIVNFSTTLNFYVTINHNNKNVSMEIDFQDMFEL